MFTELCHLIEAGTHDGVTMNLRKGDEGEIRLAVYPQLSEEREKKLSEEEIGVLTKAVVISGTIKELDEVAWDLLTEHANVLTNGSEQIESIQKEMEKVVASKKKKAPAKKAAHKPKPKTKTKAQRKEEARDAQEKGGQADMFADEKSRLKDDPPSAEEEAEDIATAADKKEEKVELKTAVEKVEENYDDLLNDL